MHTYIIAEAGVNHNGSLDLAKQLCLVAKEVGADAVKFQTWVTEKIITKSVSQAQYQMQNTNNKQSQYDMLKKLELSYDNFNTIKEYCDEIGIEFASTADEQDSLDFLIDLGIPFIKIGSGDICNVPYLRYIGSKNMPVILSTGMSTIEDIEFSINALRSGGASDISLMHCTTEYPCSYESVNLKAIDTLVKKFGLRTGYSDHTLGIEIPIAAVARGAEIIEKHITLSKHLDGPDHLASTEPVEFKKMVDAIRNVENGMGTGNKIPTNNEKETSKVVLKHIVAKQNISKGDIFTIDNICVKRSTTGLPARCWDDVIGKVSSKSYICDEGIALL